MGLMRGRRLRHCTRQGAVRVCSETMMTSRSTGRTSAITSLRSRLAPQVIPRGTQRIHQRILKKSASSIMGADLEGDERLELSKDSEDSEEGEDDEEASGDLLGDGGGVAVAGGLMADEQAVVEELAGGIGGHSRNTTPTNFVDADEINR